MEDGSIREGASVSRTTVINADGDIAFQMRNDSPAPVPPARGGVKKNEVTCAKKQEGANAPISINVSFEKRDRFELNRNSGLGRLQSEFARSIGMDVNDLRFMYGAERIRKHDTPASLGMENNDTINVRQGLFIGFKFGLEIFSYEELARKPEDRAAIRTTCSTFVGASFDIFKDTLLREIDAALKPASLSFADYRITYTTGCQCFGTPTLLQTEEDYDYFMSLGHHTKMVSVMQEKRSLENRGLKRTKDMDKDESVHGSHKKQKKATGGIMPESKEPLIPAGLQPGLDMSISEFCKTYALSNEIRALFTEGGYCTTASFEYTNITHLLNSGFLYGHVAEVKTAVSIWAEHQNA